MSTSLRLTWAQEAALNLLDVHGPRVLSIVPMRTRQALARKGMIESDTGKVTKAGEDWRDASVNRRTRAISRYWSSRCGL